MLLNSILSGAVAALSMVASLFFLRFWKSTADRFFLYFALAFFIEGCNRILLASVTGSEETTPAYYILRLIAYGLILWAIFEKNRNQNKR